MLSQSQVHCPILIAGNKAAADEVHSILSAPGRITLVTDNVMPEVNVLNVEPAREMIRKVFIERIIEAKGLKKAEDFVEGILMPTPTAVLQGRSASLPGERARKRDWATWWSSTSAGRRRMFIPSGWGIRVQAGVVRKGLPEPLAKRTVEGDLGIRYNASTILKLCGPERILENARFPIRTLRKNWILSRCVETLPESSEDKDLDFALAACAARAAMERHAGTIEALWGPQGQYYVQHGKDLTGVEHLIGTGGIFIHHPEAGDILKKTLFSRKNPFPCAPRIRTFTPMPGIASLRWACWRNDTRKPPSGLPKNI